MSKVYYKKLDNLDLSVNDYVYEMIEKVVEENNINLENVVPIKVHFGEEGNDTFIEPIYYDGIKKYLKDKNIDSCYIETNVLYKGSRTRTEDHIKTAHSHGFNDLDVVIADGNHENMYNEVVVNLKHFDKCKIGYKFKDYNNYIVASHFKGHHMAGFGGAIKQLAMGFASRGGKLHQHSDSIPFIDDKCILCGSCVRTCPVNAISIEDKAVIDRSKCVGCASCTTACPVNAIHNNWETSNFHEKLAEYAYAAQKGKSNIYVQYAFNITNDCDCNGKHMDFCSDNIGVLVSTDPVAIDKATLDLYIKNKGTVDFNKGLITLNYANEIGLGEINYNLTEL